MKSDDQWRNPVAYKNEEFLDSDDARPLRILADRRALTRSATVAARVAGPT
jgi:hypothetical protein